MLDMPRWKFRLGKKNKKEKKKASYKCCTNYCTSDMDQTVLQQFKEDYGRFWIFVHSGSIEELHVAWIYNYLDTRGDLGLVEHP